MDVVLEAQGLKGGYIIGRTKETMDYIEVLSDVSLTLYRDEILGLAGESGCGKTTLIKILYGFYKLPLTLKEGSVKLRIKEGKILDISKMNMEEKKNKVWWKKISYIPQGAMNSLNPTMRVKDHIVEILTLHAGMSKEEAYDKGLELVEQMGLPRDVYDAFPHQLSGGMKQRVVVAISMLLNPDVVLADEITSALDVIVQRGVLTYLRQMQKKNRNSIILVTHDMGVHAVVTDRIAIMYAGKIVELGPTEEVFEKPLHSYTQALIDSLPRLGDKSERRGLAGQPPSLKNPPSGCRFHPRCVKAFELCNREDPPFIEVEKGHFVACHLYSKR